jgi:hypothetical protein
MTTEIKYKIIYKDAAAIEIEFENFFNGPVGTPQTATPADITAFKTALKTLLEKQEPAIVKAFIEQILIIAGKNSTKNFDATATEPFIFAIDNKNVDKVQRTYLTFTGTNSTNTKVNFNQYSVDTIIFTNIDTELSSVFNTKLLTMKYSDYIALT